MPPWQLPLPPPWWDGIANVMELHLVNTTYPHTVVKYVHILYTWKYTYLECMIYDI